MNVGIVMLIFLLGSFALIFAFVSTPSIQYFTGGVIVALFMAGLFYVWGRAIIQTRKLEEKQNAGTPAPSSSNQS